MRQLAVYPRQHGVSAPRAARTKRTLFKLDWIDDSDLRRSTGQPRTSIATEPDQDYPYA